MLSHRDRTVSFSSLTTVLLISLSLFALISCQSKEKKGSASSIASTSSPDFLETSLAKKLPASTHGFLYWDGESPGAKGYSEYLKTSGGESSLNDWLLQIQNQQENKEDNKAVFEIINWLADEGMIPFMPSEKESVSKGVAFVDIKEDIPLPGVGAYIELKDGVDSKTKLNEFQSLLTAKGITTKKIEGENTFQGIEIPIGSTTGTPEGENPSSIKAYIGASGKYLSIATSTPLLRRGLEEAKAEGAASLQLKNSETYKNVRSYYTGGGEFVFGYLDLEKLIARALLLVPEQEKNQIPIAPEDIPFQAFALRHAYTGSLLGDFGLLMDDEKLKKQNLLYSALHPAGSNTGFQGAPKNSVLYISLADSILTSLISFAEQEIPAEQKQQFAKILDTVSGIQSIDIGILPSDGSTVFPGLFLNIGSKEVEASAEKLKNSLSAVSAEQGIPVTAWQTKDIDGTKSDYFLTPLGLGIYLAPHTSGVILSTSENSLREALLSNNKKTETLVAEVPENLQQRYSGKKPLFAAYFNSDRTAGLIRSVQGNLSMFTGGENPIDEASIEEIRKAGTTYSVASYNKGLLNLSGITLPPPPAAAKSAG